MNRNARPSYDQPGAAETLHVLNGNRLLPWSLRISVPLLLLAFGLLIGVFALFRGVMDSQRRAEASVREEARSTATVVSGLLEYFYLTGQEFGADLLISQQSSHPALRLALVVDDYNDVLLATSYRLKGQALRDTTLAALQPAFERVRQRFSRHEALSADRQTLVALSPFLLGSTPDQIRPSRVGVLCLQYDLSSVKSQELVDRLRQSGEFGLVVLLLSLLAWGYFQHLVTRRSERLVEAAGRMAAGEYRARSRLEGSDELAQISHSFDAMAEEIQGRDEAVRTARDQLAVAKEWLLITLRSIGDAVIATNVDGRIQFMNGAATQLTGWTEQEAVGRTLREVFHIIDEATRRPVDSPVERALAEGVVVALANHTLLIHKDGHETPIADSAAPIRNVEGALLGVVMVFRDATPERRSRERERELAAAEAAAEVERRRAEELRAAYDKLKEAQGQVVQSEKLASLGRLAAGIAHELKNPLAIVLQGVSYLKMAEEGTEERQREVLGMVEEAVTRADKIIRGLLSFARPSSLNLAPTNLNAVVEEALLLAERQFGLRRIAVIKTLREPLPMVFVDAVQIEQVLINLLANAFQAMPAGGQLTLRTEVQTAAKGEAGVGLRTTDPFRPGQPVVVCEVRDTGVGMLPEQLARAFDPFFTTKPPGEGTGLGLAIVHTIVELHRGAISMESEVGKGTTARVRLPAIEGRREQR